MRRSFVLALVLASCSSENNIVRGDPVDVTIETPTYGQFLGDGPIVVTGRVTPTNATVKIEGEEVAVDAEGRFTASVPFDRRWRWIEVEGASAGSYERERVPVFDGRNPLDAWPDGVTMRITPAGLARMGESVGAMIDGMGWDTMIASALPAIDTGVVALTPSGVTHDPSVVELLPATGGIDTAISLREVIVHYDMTIEMFGTWQAPVDIGFGEIAIGALAVPDVDDAGMLTLTLTQSTIQLDDPEITIAGWDGWLLEMAVDAILEWVVEPLGQLILDAALGAWGTIPLGGPFVFGTDLMGTPIEVRLSDVYGDLDGLGAGLGVGLGEPAIQGPLAIPAPEAEPDPVHLVLGVHEGLFQTMLSGGIMDMLSQDLQLPGAIGELIGSGIRQLPGGETAPAGEGYCVSLAPQPAQVARMTQSGVEPLAVLFLPDLVVDIGIIDRGICEPWLKASVAAEIGLEVNNGTEIGVDVQFVEGAVLSYGATSEWEEVEVITGLVEFLDGATSLMGGMVSFDLADLTGGLGGGGAEDPLGAVLGNVEPAIVSSGPMYGEDGQPIEGMATVGLRLWGEE